MNRPILIYDSNCGPCTTFKNVVGFLDPRSRITFAPLTSTETKSLLDEIDPDIRYRSFHLLQPGQEAESGAEALPSLFGLLPGGRLARRALLDVPPAHRAVASAYGVLSRLHGSGSCAV